MAARTLLFDLDGTLWDSYPWYGAVFHAEAGLPIEDAIRHFHNGHNIVQLAKIHGISKTRLIKACCDSIDQLSVYTDVYDVLNSLTERGTKMGVVTNLSRKIAEPILVDLGIINRFTSLIYAAGKPSPSGINKALAELQQAVGADVFYVGDTFADGEAATRAGIPFAWASFGYSQECPPNTTVVLQQFADILAL